MGSIYYCLICFIVQVGLLQSTPLDDYVERPDTAYTWIEMAEYPDLGFTSYVINMTSQIWLTTNETNQPLWWHYLILVIPDTITYTDSGFLMIDNGNLAEDVPTPSNNGRFNSTSRYAVSMGAVAADLMMIPNQRLQCDGDPLDKWRREDDLIAWTWRRYVDDTSKPDILLRLPMVKATVRAMDTITEFVALKRPGVDVQTYMVSGGSKRGWTAYLAGAVDNRVFAMVPSVLTCLNFVDVMNHQYEAYGGWSFSNKDYFNEDLMVEINEPEVRMMMEIVDPYAYRDRLTMPKLIISGVGDEHFMPDDTWYFWDDLIGHNYYWMLEDAGHDISGSKHSENIIENRITFFHALKTNFQLPVLSWERNETSTEGYIILNTDTVPLNITAVYGDTNSVTRRDFRRFIGIPDPSNPIPNPIRWTEEAVEDLGNGTYRATYDMPAEGWRCFFIKMTFDGPGGRPFYTSTETNIIPDVLPYDKCVGEECRGVLL